jgi:hypothetical protein
MSEDFNKPGRQMRVQAGVGVLVGIAAAAYVWHAEGKVERDVDRMLREDIPSALVDELVKGSCRDSASRSCLDLVKASFSNGGSCDLSRPRIDAALSALRANASYPQELREAWQHLASSCQESGSPQ